MYKKNGVILKNGQVWTVGNASIEGGGKVLITQVMGGRGYITCRDLLDEKQLPLFLKTQNFGKLVIPED